MEPIYGVDYWILDAVNVKDGADEEARHADIIQDVGLGFDKITIDPEWYSLELWRYTYAVDDPMYSFYFHNTTECFIKYNVKDNILTYEDDTFILVFKSVKKSD